MSDGIFSRRVKSIPAGTVSAVVVVMDHVLLFILVVASLLFLAGLLLISLPAGLLLALAGSTVVLYAYISLCLKFADHRGVRHI